MHLKKIKLSGFKSFVDPITIPFEGKLIGIVGPNGCGKSNIIDAVRWVMGESSAKHLRGDSMADVVFSGSTARKPVSKASVELIFDNADGSAPGQYAGFAEISIRREAGRDGQSDYFLNKTKCRRKDIIDLFLGTGAGPHAYSIIEQGMVTRIIESKPEELRGLFEEAAGVSRYKERRRETENRIRHTRENLARVEDIRKELETQLNRLQRQARAAERYKELKQEERLTRAQLIALRWQGLTTRMEEQEGTIRGMETAVEGAIAGLRGIEAEIERIRVGQTEANDRFNAVQGEFYAAGAEIANIEQAIEHARTTREERQRELEQLNAGWSEASRHLELDRERIETLTRALAEAEPAHAASVKAREEAVSSLAAAEQAMQAWQQDWEHFGSEQSEIQRVRDIQQSRLQSLARQLTQLGERRARLEEELKTLADEVRGEDIEALRRTAQGHDETCEKLERELEEREQAIRNQREQIAQQTRNIQTLRGDQQRDAARLASLRELQAAALGQHNSGLNEWLQKAGLSATPRLAKHLRVEAGWEKAVERVLGSDLAAICVPKMDGLSASLGGLNQADVTLLETGVSVTATAGGAQRLVDKVSSDMPVAGLLDGIYVAESLNDAMARRGSLASHESIITRDGAWVGRNWLSVAHEDSARAGMIGRERDIQTIEAGLADLNTRIETGQAGLAEAQRVLVAAETQRDEQRRTLQDTHRERATFKSRLGHHEALVAKVSARRAQIETELQEVVAQIARDDQEQTGSRELLANAEQQYATLEDRRSALLSRRDSCRSTLDDARKRATDTSDALHRIEVERESQRTALSSTQAGLARLEQQLAQLTERRAVIEQALAAAGDPESGLRQRLDSHLATRVAIEQRLGAARSQVSDLDAALREQEQARARQEHEIEERRQAVNDQRVARQELLVRRDTLLEQLRETEHALEEIQAVMPPEATEESWLARVTEIEGKISRLGAINLMAIEEFREQSERKGYLDKQYEDLSQALATLEDAIQKIDRETRTRFKETFDKVNTGFQTIFPKLFGGGHAYLELIGEDILDTGVRVMARPPGKRNSTIHLLSGGEKALTAVSLLFSLFELNPAPFCLLDEVDAPLDDANVVRYSDMLKAFSQKTQLIYITHNKISMEIAELLVGVTMSEPGVSRLVAVDVDQALEMVAQ